jgi:hypothetical protein
VRERSEIPKIILGSFCVLVVNAVIICIGIFVFGYVFQTYQYRSVDGPLSWLYNIAIFGSMGISITQLLYVIPVIIWLDIRRQFALTKGVIIGAVITALLNGGCWLLLISGSR